MLALHFASIVCKIELFIVYLQGSFDLVKSFVTRRPEHGGFLVIITLSMVDVVFWAVESMLLAEAESDPCSFASSILEGGGHIHGSRVDRLNELNVFRPTTEVD